MTTSLPDIAADNGAKKLLTLLSVRIFRLLTGMKKQSLLAVSMTRSFCYAPLTKSMQKRSAIAQSPNTAGQLRTAITQQIRFASHTVEAGYRIHFLARHTPAEISSTCQFQVRVRGLCRWFANNGEACEACRGKGSALHACNDASKELTRV